MRRTLFLLCLLASLGSTPVCADDFIAGADLSHLKFFEERGTSYRSNNDTSDAIGILKQRGINCARLRLFTSSPAQAQADPYNCTNNLSYVLPLAVRVKTNGLKLLLDFHFSDTWADPAHQAKPAVWTNLTYAQLQPQLRSYCSNTIAALGASNAWPDYVQIGNEITGGCLWSDGQVGGTFDTPAQWTQLGTLLKAAIQGVNDAAGRNAPKFIVHLDRGGDWATTQWFFDHLNAQSVPYDIIGESYYPFWHGSLDDLRNCLTNVVKRYNKPVLIAESGFPFSNSTNLLGFTATTNGQVDYVIALAQVVKGLPGGNGIAIVWWAAEYQNLSGYNLAGFNTRSLFASGGNVVPAAGALGQLAAPLVITARPTNGLLELKWPLSGAGMPLMTTTSPLPTVNWQPVTNLIQATGTTFRVMLPTDAPPRRFYRLQAN